jgi:hypothetical protein
MSRDDDPIMAILRKIRKDRDATQLGPVDALFRHATDAEIRAWIEAHQVDDEDEIRKVWGG